MGVLTEQPIPTLFGGVSRQPSAVRRPNQVSVGDNALFSVVTGGFEKRPNTQTIAKLANVDNTVDYAVHVIDRDPTEQYIVLLASGSILVYDAITGAQKTVNIGDTEHYFVIDGDASGVATIISSEEIAWSSAETELSWVFECTHATPVIQIEGSDTGAFGGEEDVLDTFNGTSDTGTTVIANDQHKFIRVKVTTGQASQTFTLKATFKDLSYLLETDPEDFAFVSVADFTFISARTQLTRMAEAGTGTVTSTVQVFGDLPALSGSGNIHRVVGDAADDFSTYFVQDDTTLSMWLETVDPNASNKFDPSTLPHQLVRESDGTFTYKAATWPDRAVGDATVVPQPSWVGKSITDVYFFRNRLGFLADEIVYQSRTGDAFNMWPEKAVTTLDTDPIERAASTTKVTLLRWAEVFRKILFVTSDVAQFEMSALDKYTPDTAAFDLATSYQTSPNAKPTAMGDVLYFASSTPRAAVLFEYFFDDNSLSNTAADVTKHVVDYIPTEILKIATDPTTGTAFILSTGESNSLFVYRVFFDKAEKLQSAWGRYTFGDTVSKAFIHGIAVLSGFLVLVVERQDGSIYLEQAVIETEAIDTDLGFIPLLDQREVPTGVYDSGDDCTTWTSTYEHEDDLTVILGGAFAAGQPGRTLSVVYPDKYTLALSTVLANDDIIINGVTFTAHATVTDASINQFKISGNDSADADELALVINDATDGLGGGANPLNASNASGTITLTVEDACDGTITISSVPATITVTEVDDLTAARGDFSAGAAYVGRPYIQTVELSKIFMRSEDGRAIISGRLQLRDMTVSFINTGYFKVTVTPLVRTPRSREFTGRVLGSASNTVGAAAIEAEGTYRFPVLSKADTVKIEIINDTPYPSVITAASWRGMFNEISRAA